MHMVNFLTFARYPIIRDKVVWHTSEHYSKQCNFLMNRIINIKYKTTKICHDIKKYVVLKNKLRSDWEDVNDKMMNALRAKKDQYPELKTVIIIKRRELA